MKVDASKPWEKNAKSEDFSDFRGCFLFQNKEKSVELPVVRFGGNPGNPDFVRPGLRKDLFEKSREAASW